MVKLTLGRGFSDSLEVGKKKRSIIKPQKLRGWGGRMTLLYTILLVAFFGLALRLFHLTVVQGQENRKLSEANRIKTAIIHAPRGIISDRRGVALVENVPALRLIPYCEAGKSCGSEFVTEEQWKKNQSQYQNMYRERDYMRQVLYPFETAHVLGYLGEVTAEELKNPYYIYQGYLSEDRLGRMGVEQRFEKELRGANGKELIEVDAGYTIVRSLGKVEARRGHDLTLSIDLELQKKAYEAMAQKKGAVIATKPKTGEVLALVSAPGFDANTIHAGLSTKEYMSIFEDPRQPLFNRAVNGVYAPGSTFKIISAVAGLESGKITPQTLIEDTGILKVGAFTFRNWYFTQYGKTEGMVNIVKALARSNDIYFYKLGETVGISDIAHWGKKFGIGRKSGIELPAEAEGVMPDKEWRRLTRGEEWYLGDDYHVAIGQGDLQVTPLQVNMWTNAIASGGSLCQPTLIKLTDPLGRSAHCKNLEMQKSTLDTITYGMRLACTSEDESQFRGTGYPLFGFTVTKETFTQESGKAEKRRVPVACKTGTSEFGDPSGKTHAWFTAFAPLPQAHITSDIPVIEGEPEIVVTVLVEAGGEGSAVAAPIAKEVLTEWFKR